MSGKISKLAKWVFLGRREYSGTVTSVSYADEVESREKFTIYRIKTRRKKVIRCSIRGGSNYDNSLQEKDQVEVTLGRLNEGPSMIESIKKIHCNGRISIRGKQFAWPPIKSYRLLERRLDEPFTDNGLN